ncbi:MAG: YaeQ family protein [Gammaproteobacteria bacterium]|nr:YaeQ family protein [Gammaproteobacteria bacterium]
MATKATVFKFELQISDMDRQCYQSHSLTLARHPSETDERMMVRLLAFALCSDAALGFGRGISADDDPDLWRKSLSGEIELWIDLGLPDERRIRKACGRSKQVIVVCYGGRTAETWWGQHQNKLARIKNLTVLNIPAGSLGPLESGIERTMALECTIDAGQLWLFRGAESTSVEPETWHGGLAQAVG